MSDQDDLEESEDFENLETASVEAHCSESFFRPRSSRELFGSF